MAPLASRRQHKRCSHVGARTSVQEGGQERALALDSQELREQLLVDAEALADLVLEPG